MPDSAYDTGGGDSALHLLPTGGGTGWLTPGSQATAANDTPPSAARPSPPGPGGSGSLTWADIGKSAALAAGQALIGRIFPSHSDSRSTKGSSLPPVPTQSGAIPNEAWSSGAGDSELHVTPQPARSAGVPAGVPGSISPLILAGVAGLALLLYLKR